MDISPDKFIGACLKILLNDSRTLEGVLTVMDPFGNLLMSNVYETNQDNYREIGLVSVPRESIAKVYITKRGYQQLMKVNQLETMA